MGENHNQREGGLDVKFNTYRNGVITFFSLSFLKTGKVVEELLEFTSCTCLHWN